MNLDPPPLGLRPSVRPDTLEDVTQALREPHAKARGLLRAVAFFVVLLAGNSNLVMAQEPTGSYLKVPRIHFSGEFYCDVSTVNNNPDNYEPSVTSPEPWWNPNGDHSIYFRDCVVTGVYDDQGTFHHQIAGDPITAAKVDSSVGVLVDLDTDQQGVSTFFGFDVHLDLPKADGTALRVGGAMDPAGLNGLWWQVMPALAGGRGGDFNASACYQSVLRIDPAQWPMESSSPVLDQLRTACDVDDAGRLMVLIAFTTNAYQDSNVSPGFRVGSVTGTLAPRKATDPIHTPGQRWLKPRPFDPSNPDEQEYGHKGTMRWDFQPFNGGPFFVDEARKRLVVDLGNSIPISREPKRAEGGASYQDVSAISGVTAYVVHDGERTELGSLDVSSFNHLEAAGVSEVSLTDEQVALLRDHPLQLVATRVNSGSRVILAEEPSGIDFAVTERVFRMASDIPDCEEPVLGTVKKATTAALVTQWGRPKSGIQLHIKGEDLSGAAKKVTNGDTLKWSISPSGADGRALISFEAVGDPGDRTPELDGQVYGFAVDDEPFTGPVNLPNLAHGREDLGDSYGAPMQERMVSIHVYSNHAVIERPLWADIESIMSPYAKLYPAMRDRIDLSVEDTFIFYSLQPPGGMPPLPMFLSAPFGTTGYMPITRDLSPNKHATVMNFIRNLSEPANGGGK